MAALQKTSPKLRLLLAISSSLILAGCGATHIDNPQNLAVDASAEGKIIDAVNAYAKATKHWPGPPAKMDYYAKYEGSVLVRATGSRGSFVVEINTSDDHIVEEVDVG